ncbi:hypothetical protein AAFF_G00009420 [Aldrovandia affinis]|uniref:Uncharacterized protein n=1 Tax=Aldrovandia affinis TaxID=143900 RepID=A0AAD7X0T6_9TELE|nr:hypothetical protein AAFF_G00009420 [Aldrovandia affinis]
MLLLGIVVLVALAAGTLHVQCFVKWIISLPCGDVASLLVGQINYWTTDDCPGKSQKCLYALISVSDNIIASHKIPVLSFVDDIECVFRPAESDGCVVWGHSVSGSSYAILDLAINYHNMYNLMKGSGLSFTLGFRNGTQYSTVKQLLGL